MKNNINELSMIDKAIDFAQLSHINQKRKSSGKPYIIHPMAVFLLAKRFHYPKELQIVAILHDTYEDSKNKSKTLHKIKSLFGNTIAKYVMVLAHEKEIKFHIYLYNMARKYPKIFMVKLLDIYHNLEDNPTEKQKKKYVKALNYIINKGIKIDDKIMQILKHHLIHREINIGEYRI